MLERLYLYRDSFVSRLKFFDTFISLFTGMKDLCLSFTSYRHSQSYPAIPLRMFVKNLNYIHLFIISSWWTPDREGKDCSSPGSRGEIRGVKKVESGGNRTLQTEAQG